MPILSPSWIINGHTIFLSNIEILRLWNLLIQHLFGTLTILIFHTNLRWSSKLINFVNTNMFLTTNRSTFASCYSDMLILIHHSVVSIHNHFLLTNIISSLSHIYIPCVLRIYSENSTIWQNLMWSSKNLNLWGRLAWWSCLK